MIKIKQRYSFKSNKQIWRIIPTSTDKLIFETRNTESREVFFTCIDLETGRAYFKDFQFDEKYYIGIEATHGDVILLHKYIQPDLPTHKEIIAFDLLSQKILWHNELLTYYAVYENLVYGFRQKFESRDYYSLDINTGEITQELGGNINDVNEIKTKADSEMGGDDYIFPMAMDLSSPELENIKKLTGDVAIEGLVEYNIMRNHYVINYHYRSKKNGLTNKFIIVDLDESKVVFNKILDTNLNLFQPDSFFIYKDFLFLLEGKKKVSICKII